MLPTILSGTTPSRKWQSKEGAFKMIATLSETVPEALQALLPDIVPVVRGAGWGGQGVPAQVAAISVMLRTMINLAVPVAHGTAM